MLHTCVIIVEGTRLRWHAWISNTTTMLIHLTEMDQVHAYIHNVSTVTCLPVYQGARSWFLSWLVFLCVHNIQGSKNILPPKPVKMQGWSHRSSSCMENQPVENVLEQGGVCHDILTTQVKIHQLQGTLDTYYADQTTQSLNSYDSVPIGHNTLKAKMKELN